MNPAQLVIKAFHERVQWNLFGSALYESLRILHNSILAFLIEPKLFGLIGSLFAITFLAVRLSDCGATNSLLPFFGHIEKSQQAFDALFVRKFLLPLVITATLGASIAINFLFYTLPPTTISTDCLAIIFFLIISETIRSFARQFLHLAGQSKETVMIDHIAFLGYIFLCWPGILFFPLLRTPIFILALFLFDSLIGTCALIHLIYQFRDQLPIHPATDTNNIYTTKPKGFYTNRLYAALLRFFKEIFSSNALTPIFAITVGLEQAGLFYFAATTAMALYAIMRSVVGYAGGAFFIAARKANIPMHNAFNLVSSKLTMMLATLVLFAIFSYHNIIRFTHTQVANHQIMLFFILYFSIIMFEFALFLYEQQFQLEHYIQKALLWRSFEFFLVYIASHNLVTLTPIETLMCILTAKGVTLAALTASSYKRWGTSISLQLTKQQIIIIILVSALLAILFKWYLLAWGLL